MGYVNRYSNVVSYVMLQYIQLLEKNQQTTATNLTNLENGISLLNTKMLELDNHAFSSPINNLTTTEDGYTLDATQGKILNDKYETLNSNINNIINDNLTNYSIGHNLTFEQLTSLRRPTFFTNWVDETNFPAPYGSGFIIPGLDARVTFMIYFCRDKMCARVRSDNAWGDWFIMSEQPLHMDGCAYLIDGWTGTIGAIKEKYTIYLNFEVYGATSYSPEMEIIRFGQISSEITPIRPMYFVVAVNDSDGNYLGNARLTIDTYGLLSLRFSETLSTSTSLCVIGNICYTLY